MLVKGATVVPVHTFKTNTFPDGVQPSHVLKARKSLMPPVILSRSIFNWSSDAAAGSMAWSRLSQAKFSHITRSVWLKAWEDIEFNMMGSVTWTYFPYCLPSFVREINLFRSPEVDHHHHPPPSLTLKIPMIYRQIYFWGFHSIAPRHLDVIAKTAISHRIIYLKFQYCNTSLTWSDSLISNQPCWNISLIIHGQTVKNNIIVMDIYSEKYKSSIYLL